MNVNQSATKDELYRSFDKTFLGLFQSIKTSLSVSFPHTHLEIVEDAVEESLCCYFENAPQHVRDSSTKTYSWLYTVAKRCLMKEISRSKKYFYLIENLEVGNEFFLSWSFNPTYKNHFEFISIEEATRIDKITLDVLLEYLPSNTKMIFDKMLEGYNMLEIAKEEECSTQTLYKRFERGLVKLRQLCISEIGCIPPPSYWKKDQQNMKIEMIYVS